MENESLVKRVLDVLPKGSIGRYDLFPIFKDAELFTEIIQYLAAPYIGKVDYVSAPEAIGWVMGSAMARELNVGFIPLRKIDKLPYPKELLLSQSYVDYSGKTKTLEIKKDCVAAGDITPAAKSRKSFPAFCCRSNNILIVDEWVETGASLHCCVKLLERLGCNIVGLATIGIDYCDGTKNWIDTDFIRYIGKDI